MVNECLIEFLRKTEPGRIFPATNSYNEGRSSKSTFAKFNLDHGFWEWNDWELCFPMEKLSNKTVRPEFSE